MNKTNEILIKEVAVDFILQASKNLYPREFMGLLRMEEGVITEILVLPQSIWGEGFSSIGLMHMPYDSTIVGSVHSHPSTDGSPSKTDLREFGRSGKIHIIAAYPFDGLKDLGCYLSDGERVGLRYHDED
jgi:proteasome lid subunit RPN8/RPN11